LHFRGAEFLLMAYCRPTVQNHDQLRKLGIAYVLNVAAEVGHRVFCPLLAYRVFSLLSPFSIERSVGHSYGCAALAGDPYPG